MEVVARTLWYICVALLCGVLSSCATVDGVVVHRAPGIRYVKLVPSRDAVVIDEIVKAAEPVQPGELVTDEHRRLGFDAIRSDFCRRARKGVYVTRYVFRPYCQEVRILPAKRPTVVLQQEEGSLLVKEEAAHESVRRIRDDDLGRLWRILSPWRSDEEERRAASRPPEDLEFGLFPAD